MKVPIENPVSERKRRAVCKAPWNRLSTRPVLSSAASKAASNVMLTRLLSSHFFRYGLDRCQNLKPFIQDSSALRDNVLQREIEGI